MTRLAQCAAYPLLFACLVLTGCSGGISKGIVEGTVTLDEQPVPEGLIRFVPADGNTPTADAPIKAGKYRAEVPVGDKRVEIFAPKVVGTKKMYDTPDSPVVSETVESLPERYNFKSELTLTVKKGQQQVPYPLTLSEKAARSPK